MQARASYEAAASSLPVVDPPTENQNSICEETWSETSFPRAYTPSPTFSNYHPSASSSPTSMYSVSSADNEYNDVARRPPLRICTDMDYPKDYNTPITPLSAKVPSHRTPPSTKPTSSSTTWLQSRTYSRFSANLSSFSEMLAGHTAAIESLIAITREVQANRYNVAAKQARLPRYGEDELAKAKDLQMRIHRLRENGWRPREPFQPERYIQLCERALAEL